MVGIFAVGDKVKIIEHHKDQKLIGKKGLITKEGTPIFVGNVDEIRKSLGTAFLSNISISEGRREIKFWIVKLDDTGEEVECPSPGLKIG